MRTLTGLQTRLLVPAKDQLSSVQCSYS